MPTLLLKFYVYLKRIDVMRDFEGPLFHRWLPDGEKDALVLDVGTENAVLKVWFERRGFLERGLVRYDVTRKEVDPAVIPTQAALTAGSLFGSLGIQGLIEEVVTSIRENKIGDASYIALGDRVVNKLIYPSVNRFITTLRGKYGQYWIRELPKWDSRNETLGAYCHSLLLKWSLDQGATWSDFTPDQPISYTTAITGTPESFRKYLTQDDWKDLAQIDSQKYELPLASTFLARANQLLDEEDYKYALIEGITALELAVSETIKPKLQADGNLVKSIQRFWTLPISTQVILVATLSGRISQENLSHSLQSIEISNSIRNEAVHEGKFPKGEMKAHISGLLNTVAALLFGSNYKLPSARLGNRIMPIEAWEQHSEEH
jgi:hypothetical protein